MRERERKERGEIPKIENRKKNDIFFGIVIFVFT
jgi:hypothetical protein